VLSAILGGVVGALILIVAYFAGVALVGAGTGAMLLHVMLAAFDREPHIILVVLAAIGGAIAAMRLQRYVIILTTAFGGAWTALVGAFALAGEGRAVAATARGDVWIAYPLNPAPGQHWVIAAWIVLGIAGTVVQARKGGKR
jgi:hypothetical protein